MPGTPPRPTRRPPCRRRGRPGPASSCWRPFPLPAWSRPAGKLWAGRSDRHQSPGLSRRSTGRRCRCWGWWCRGRGPGISSRTECFSRSASSPPPRLFPHRPAVRRRSANRNFLPFKWESRRETCWRMLSSVEREETKASTVNWQRGTLAEKTGITRRGNNRQPLSSIFTCAL